MLGLTTGEASLVALLIFGVVSAKFWPAAGASIADWLAGPRAREQRDDGAGRAPPKSERTNGGDST